MGMNRISNTSSLGIRMCCCKERHHRLSDITSHPYNNRNYTTGKATGIMACEIDKKCDPLFGNPLQQHFSVDQFVKVSQNYVMAGFSQRRIIAVSVDVDYPFISSGFVHVVSGLPTLIASIESITILFKYIFTLFLKSYNIGE
uniref:Uncharacterized protein n=1 Tax=Spongospora subterranea TaxID=70186 RepID=A0A0H5QS97_9EUKA|eukprot:CRZ04547.1 hypothetical protein [Spongospora subterranea]